MFSTDGPDLRVLVLRLGREAGGVFFSSLHAHQLHLGLREAEDEARQQRRDGQSVGQGQTHQTRIHGAEPVLDHGDRPEARHHRHPDQLQAHVQPLRGGAAQEQAALVLLQAFGTFLLEPTKQVGIGSARKTRFNLEPGLTWQKRRWPGRSPARSASPRSASTRATASGCTGA